MTEKPNTIIKEHSRSFNLEGDVEPLKDYLRSQGFSVIYSGIDGYDVIFDGEKLGGSVASEGQIDYIHKRLVVFASTRLEGTVKEIV